MDNGADGVQNVFAGQVISRCDFRPSRFFHVSLLFHQFCACQAKLNPGEGMDRVVDAAVIGAEAAQHLAVGGVDNGVTAQGGNVALP